MKRETERFQARAADGRTFTLVVYQYYSPDRDPVELQAEVRTADGRAVNRKSDTDFEILDVLEDLIPVKRI